MMHLHFWRYLDVTAGSSCRVLGAGPARCASCGDVIWMPWAGRRERDPLVVAMGW